MWKESSQHHYAICVSKIDLLEDDHCWIRLLVNDQWLAVRAIIFQFTPNSDPFGSQQFHPVAICASELDVEDDEAIYFCMLNEHASDLEEFIELQSLIQDSFFNMTTQSKLQSFDCPALAVPLDLLFPEYRSFLNLDYGQLEMASSEVIESVAEAFPEGFDPSKGAIGQSKLLSL